MTETLTAKRRELWAYMQTQHQYYQMFPSDMNNPYHPYVWENYKKDILNPLLERLVKGEVTLHEAAEEIAEYNSTH